MDSECMDKLISDNNLLTELLCSQQEDNKRNKSVQEFLKVMKIPPISDFPIGAEWFNVSQPISLKHLQGKVIVLDFFTYCCINCMHILPDLKALEEEFSVEDGLVVIGVHSAKFDNEKDSANILSAVQRYNITHPVVNDANAEFWNKLSICCWPTILILGPDANPIFILMGEGHKEDLFLYIRNTLQFYKNFNKIRNDPLPVLSANRNHLRASADGPLLFPGKITCLRNHNSDILAIADTGNNRILISNANGIVSHIVGGDGPGLKDGTLKEAKFNAPQGLTFLDEHTLFVADTENHAIRKIDLLSETVLTVAGNGTQGIDRIGGNIGTAQEISSPWDVCIFSTPDMDMSFHGPNDPIINKNVLLIAMAGTHQIWALFLDDVIWWKFKKFPVGSCLAVAGSGREENRNNAYPHAAAFAQPSGITLNPEKKEIYIADSESSSIRRVSLADGKVTAVVGGNRSPTNLFDFGDIDGKQYDAKLQHPLGVAFSPNGSVYIADSYNHKIKKIDTDLNVVTSVYGTGKPGDNISNPKSIIQFNEPGGLCVSNNGKNLFIADTNNHCVKVVDVSKKHVSSKISFVLPEEKTIAPLRLREAIEINSNGGDMLLAVRFNFETSLKLNSEAPRRITLKAPNTFTISDATSGNPANILVNVPKISPGTIPLILSVALVTCKGDKCIPLSTKIEIKLLGTKTASAELKKHINLFVSDKQINLQ